MAEVQSRSSTTRGRGSGRSGRGGFSSRGGRQSNPQKAANDEMPTALPMVSLDEQGEIGQLKKKHATQLENLRAICPDWSDDDLVLTLQETDGDAERAYERISEGKCSDLKTMSLQVLIPSVSTGHASQFSDVHKKTKEKSKVKKEPGTTEPNASATRGRGRGGYENSRGTRGRGNERGGRGRGGRGGTSSAQRATSAAPVTAELNTLDSTAAAPANVSWDDPSAGIDWEKNATDGTAALTPSSTTEAMSAPEPAKSSIIPQGSKKSWASMLAQPKAAPAVPKPTPVPPTEPVEEAVPSYEPQAEQQDLDTATATASEDSAIQDGVPSLQVTESDNVAETPPAMSTTGTDNAVDLTPPRDQLTEDNLEHLPDTSSPVTTDTVASTRDASSTIGAGTPLAGSQTSGAAGRPPMGGYATTAWKAAGAPGRSASYQKRILEQRQPVVMPNDRAVDRAAVQFGSMGLNGESRPLDVDDDREEAQTRAPVAQSPPAQPRTALPPAPQQPSIMNEPPTPETISTQKQAPGLPMPSQSAAMPGPGPTASQQPPGGHAVQPGLGYGSYSRYGAGPIGQEQASSNAKPYDSYGQQTNYSQAQAESHSTYGSQAPGSHMQQNNPAGYGDYASHYNQDQQRGGYGGYYGGYGQHTAASQNEQQTGPQRTGSAFANADSGYGSNQPAAAQSRLTESHHSGHSTPNPTAASQQQMGSQPQQMHHAHSQAQGHGGYQGAHPYQQQHPYYSGGYYSYMGQVRCSP